MLEPIIFDELSPDIHQRLIAKQHGFIDDRSLESNILLFTNRIYENFENKDQVVVAHVDFSNTLDSVYHKILIKKISNSRILRKLLD